MQNKLAMIVGTNFVNEFRDNSRNERSDWQAIRDKNARGSAGTQANGRSASAPASVESRTNVNCQCMTPIRR